MRWHELITARDDEARLPGLSDGAVTRTFDAPEALNARFHEVHAKSALNRVPGGNRLPFGWTVNPYRGCLHACAYCSWGEARVLLANGRARRMADLRPGDEIQGTRLVDGDRRIVRTIVRDHWCVSKPAHRTRLADGTLLLTSGDHRVLTADGTWRSIATADKPAVSRGDVVVAMEESGLRMHDGVVIDSVEPLGKAMRLYDITTGAGDYIADWVVHHNCFARPTHEYLEFDAGKDFDEQIVVKVNAPEVLRAELKRPSWSGEHVALGTNTDPYQWVEKRYGLTRGVLEALRDAHNPCSVLTKSPLLLRDLDLFLELLEVTDFSACLSIPTLDEKAWRATEPHTPHPRKRLEAVAALNAAGVPTGVLIAPLMPHINDAPEQVETLVAACREAGARTIGGQALFLRGATKAVFMERLEAWRPELVPVYQRLYGKHAHLSAADRQATEGRLRALTGRRRTQAELAERFQRGASLQQAGHGVAAPAPTSAPPPGGAALQEKLF